MIETTTISAIVIGVGIILIAGLIIGIGAAHIDTISRRDKRSGGMASYRRRSADRYHADDNVEQLTKEQTT